MSNKEIGWLWLPAHAGVEVGQTLTTEGLEHVSPRALDALAHASGPVICRISSSGKVLAMADATTVLHEFMCWSAEQALLGEREAGREPDKQSWAAIETKRKWLKGEATDEELIAAENAAWDAEVEIWEASYVISDVALAAARAAARDAARDAVSAAAAAGAAARAAAGAATRDAVSAVTRAACDVANAAAWTEAGDASKEIWKAAWDNAWNAQSTKLEEMLNDLYTETPDPITGLPYDLRQAATKEEAIKGLV